MSAAKLCLEAVVLELANFVILCSVLYDVINMRCTLSGEGKSKGTAGEIKR